MAVKDTRTPQEVNPHAELIRVRNLVQEHCGVTRKEAASIANHLSHEECDQVLEAADDAKKVQHVAEGGWRAAEKKKAAKEKAAAKEKPKSK